MAKNYYGKGDVLPFTAPAGGVVAGNMYLIGKFAVVATVTAAAGVKFSGGLTECWTVNKVTAEPWTEGMLVYFNTGTGLATSISTGTVLVGGAVGAAVNPSTTGVVRLNGDTTP